MKLCTYQSAHGPRVGVVANGQVFDGGLDASMVEVIRDWPTAKAALEAAAKTGQGLALDSVRLLAPVLRPGKIFAIGLNYADHIAESYESRGVPENEAERRAWATVNKEDGGGKMPGGSGRGRSTGHPAAHHGGEGMA